MTVLFFCKPLIVFSLSRISPFMRSILLLLCTLSLNVIFRMCPDQKLICHSTKDLGRSVNLLATTKHGYDHYELLSAMQKCIRRGMDYEAVHFAAELEEFNPTMLWNRLKIIACEDIGPANPTMPLLIDLLHKQYLAEKSKLAESSYKLFFVNAVVCLCRSQKSRITDDLLNVVYAERECEGKFLAIPDFALDMHTREGKSKGRGIDHFFSEGNRLENEAFVNEYTDRAKELLKKHSKPKNES